MGEIARALREGEANLAPAPKLRILTPEQKLARCRAIWRNSGPLFGSPAERYLRETRGVTIPTIGPAVRFNKRIWHPNHKIYLPAMVSRVTDLSGKGTGLHFTFLRIDGNRVVQIEENAKIMFGSVKTHAVRFPGSVTDCLILTEGLETGLRAKQRAMKGGFDLPVWGCLSACGIENCAIPADVREVFIAADHDANGVGERAATRKVDELRARGIKANWNMPREVGRDYADF